MFSRSSALVLLRLVTFIALTCSGLTVLSADPLADLHKQAEQAFRTNDFATVESSFEKFVAYSEENFSRDHSNTAYGYLKLGEIQLIRGKLNEAEDSFSQSHEIYSKIRGANGRDAMNILSRLAMLHGQLGDFEAAETSYLTAYEGLLKANSSTDAHVILANLGELYREMGNYRQAETIFSELLTSGKAGDSAPEIKNNLALVYQSTGREQEAIELFEEVYASHMQSKGKEHPLTLHTKFNLATIYGEMNQEAEAETMFRELIQTWTDSTGSTSLQTGLALTGLAVLLKDMGRYEEAIEVNQKTTQITETIQGPDHQNMVFNLSRLAALYAAVGESEKGERATQDLLRVQNITWSKVLSYFSEEAALSFLAKANPMQAPALVQSGPLAAEAAIRFKGAIGDTISHRRAMEARLADSKGAQELLARRDQLAAEYRYALLAGGQTDELAQSLEAELDQINKDILVLSREEGGSLPTDTTLESVQSALQANQVLIETFRYLKETGPDKGQNFYASALIQPSGEPLSIDHGSAADIEGWIKQYRSAFDPTLRAGFKEEQWRVAESQLYTTLLEPLTPYLAAGSQVIISADASLHFLPLGMLRSKESVPFEMQHPIRYVNSGRDLLEPTSSNAPGDSKALIVANPDFAQEIVAFPRALKMDSLRRKLAKNDNLDFREATRGVQLKDLPGTAEEATRIKAKLESQYELSLLAGSEATEAAFTELIQSSSQDILHFATHGFFLPDTHVGAGLTKGLGSGPRVVQNPMLQSGLALVGAQSTLQHWSNNTIPDPPADGVLTASEIAMLDLSGTNLVTLSACDTAVGDTFDGEGVMGLRRAFQAAGAQNVVLTLWPISDNSTVVFMDHFYEHLLAGGSPAEALLQTRKELYEDWVDEHGELGALFRLAPFLCVGR